LRLQTQQLVTAGAKSSTRAGMRGCAATVCLLPNIAINLATEIDDLLADLTQQ